MRSAAAHARAAEDRRRAAGLGPDAARERGMEPAAQPPLTLALARPPPPVAVPETQEALRQPEGPLAAPSVRQLRRGSWLVLRGCYLQQAERPASARRAPARVTPGQLLLSWSSRCPAG